MELVQNYLILRHPAEHLPKVEQEEVVTPGDQEEDSFSQYYSAKLPRGREKKPDAVKLRGEKLVHEDMHITELELSVREVHAQAKCLRCLNYSAAHCSDALSNSRGSAKGPAE